MSSRWLIVDPDPEAGEATAALLRRFHQRALVVHSARRALDVLTSAPVDGVVCEVRVPRVDGFELCAELSRLPQTRHIPFFLVSHEVIPEERDIARRIGARGLLAKPLSTESLHLLAAALRNPTPPPIVVGVAAESGAVATAPPRRETRSLTIAPRETRPIAPPAPTTRLTCGSCGREYALPYELDDDRLLSECRDCVGST